MSPISADQRIKVQWTDRVMDRAAIRMSDYLWNILKRLKVDFRLNSTICLSYEQKLFKYITLAFVTSYCTITNRTCISKLPCPILGQGRGYQASNDLFSHIHHGRTELARVIHVGRTCLQSTLNN